jgi:beta-alanine degradation protein BauB
MPDPVGTELLYETPEVRVWNLVLQAGQSTPQHQHECDYIYVVIAPGDTETVYSDGTGHRHQDKAGEAVYVKRDAAHVLVNHGDSTYVNVIVELLGTVRDDVGG